MAEKAILDRLVERYGYGENALIDPRDLDNAAARKLFQRELKPRDWERFVPVLFGRPIVAEVKIGRKVVLVSLDGQHRSYEAEVAGETEVPVVLYPGMSPEDAAAVFDLINSDRKGLAAEDEFRAAIHSGAEAPTALDKALLERGLDGTCRREGYKHLSVISSVRVLQKELGLEHTLYTLDVIRAVWPWDGPTAVAVSPHTRVLRGMGQVLREERSRSRSASDSTKYIYRWDRENTDLFVEHLRLKYNQLGNIGELLTKAQALALGGGGGGGSLGMQIALDDEFRVACRNADVPPYRPVRARKAKVKAAATKVTKPVKAQEAVAV